MTCHPFASAIALALVGVRDRAAARTRFDNILDDAERVSSCQREGEGKGDRRRTRGREPVMTMMISLSEKVGLSMFGSGGFRTTLHDCPHSFTLSVIDHLLDISWCIAHLLSPENLCYYLFFPLT